MLCSIAGKDPGGQGARLLFGHTRCEVNNEANHQPENDGHDCLVNNANAFDLQIITCEQDEKEHRHVNELRTSARVFSRFSRTSVLSG